ncbi:hypothetical protein PanWU01x14_129760, partial [Parasponia andersonii]
TNKGRTEIEKKKKTNKRRDMDRQSKNKFNLVIMIAITVVIMAISFVPPALASFEDNNIEHPFEAHYEVLMDDQLKANCGSRCHSSSQCSSGCWCNKRPYWKLGHCAGSCCLSTVA